MSSTLDDEVAREVMGWADGAPASCYTINGKWSPSTNNDQALMVLHCCCFIHGAKAEIKVDLNMAEVSMGPQVFGAYVTCDPEDGIDGLALAICRAALAHVRDMRKAMP